MTAVHRRDALLAAGTLAIFLVVFVVVEASFSVVFGLGGAIGTVVFEAIAMQRVQAVRRYWEQPAVQTGAVLVALGIAVGGALIAPAAVLSAGIGTLVTYLGLLPLLEARLQTQRTS